MSTTEEHQERDELLESALIEYRIATEAQHAAEAAVTHYRNVRARLLAELNAQGLSYAKLAAALGLDSRVQAQRLVEHGRELP